METNKRPPAFQLYPQDFISSLDVQMMSAAEVGAYCLLLFNSWTQPRQGYLPNDDVQLQFMSRLTPDQWKQSKKRLLSKFVVTPDKKHRYNPRLLSEVDKQTAFREKQAENGKRGGRPRREEQSPPDSLGPSQKNPSLSQPLEVANPMPKPKKALQSSTSSSTSSSLPLPSVEGAGAEELEVIPPFLDAADDASHTEGGADDVGTSFEVSRGGSWQYDPAAIAANLVLPFDSPDFRQAWVAYRTYREEKKYGRLSGGMQEQEALRQLGILAAGDPQRAISIIGQTIAKGWKDLYKLDEPRFATRQPAPGQSGAGAKPVASDAADVAEFLVRRRFNQPGGTAGDTGQTTGAYPGQGPTGAASISPHANGRGVGG